MSGASWRAADGAAGPAAGREAPTRRVYVDLDDVVAEMTSGFPDLVLKLFGRTRAFDELSSFDLGEAFGLEEDELSRLLDHVHRDAWLLELRPRAGAREVLEGWQRRGDDIQVVTGRPPSTRKATRRWLDREGLAGAGLHLIDKYGRFADHPEARALSELAGMDFDLAIEDSADMAGWLAEQGIGTVLLMDRPWNLEARWSEAARERVVRVSGWAEIAERVLS